jgi:iron complex transport system ATP-binding protein
MINISHLEIGYKNRSHNSSIFKGITMTLNAGDLVGLMGDNGVGKSTLLKTITGDLMPLAGEITIESKNIKSYSVQELAQLISIVTTQKIGGFNLTVWDVVSAGRIPYINIFGKLTAHDEAIAWSN